MKLSEAITLGSTVVVPKPGVLKAFDEQAGCALGMAYIAAGYGFVTVSATDTNRVAKTETEWPWLTRIMRRPCSCWFNLDSTGDILLKKELPANQIIAHLFDRHVFGKKDWTLDDLTDWVKSVEPATLDEEEPAYITQDRWNGA